MKTNIRYIIEYTLYVEVYYFSGKHRRFHKCDRPGTVIDFMNTANTVHKYGDKKQYATYKNN